MKNPLSRLFIIGFLFTAALGTLSHFLYDLSGQNIIVGLFTPINESIWEHIKLLFFPMLLFTLFAVYHYGKQNPRLAPALLWGILFGSLLIPMLYYTYTGAFGIHLSAIDITIYYVCALTAFLSAYLSLNNCTIPNNIFIPRLLVLALFAAFIFFTFVPPPLPLFTAP
ncbi:MAG: hypothetical protein IJX66_05985 [Lachnospiraceae bacterium]|nr:hypothetical protein [Lachnospiraceae bacterium]